MSEHLVLTPAETSLLQIECDAVILPLTQDGELSENAVQVNRLLDGLLMELRENREFRGEAYSVTILPTLGRLSARRVALVGLGKAGEVNRNTCVLAVASAARALGKRGLAVAAADALDLPLPAAEAAEVWAEGAELARFEMDTYRTGEKRPRQLRELRVTGATEEALRQGGIRSRAKNLARELVNEPSNVLDPPELARRALAVAAEVGLAAEVLEVADMERLKMGAILDVTRGSDTPAKFIILRHTPVPDGPLLALVGKAVCFDTGGISIKPAADMGKMKGDMAGGAAVLGAMQAIAELQIPVNVIGMIPAVLNMPDGRAWRPGDVTTAMNGKTIECISTDAEGRMLLADAVHYATTLGATHIVDIATLTGACAIALGSVASGLYGTDDELVTAVREAGAEADELHWPMPLFKEYKEAIRSEIADLKNSGGRLAGSITAAWFIREFAGDTPWAHLDLAGSFSYEKGKPWAPAGPTGTGVGTFINLAQRLAEQEG